MKIEKYITFVLIVLLLGILIYPHAQKRYKIHNEGYLRGYVNKITLEKYSNESFLEGTFQNNRELFISRDFGFRTWFVRAFNQANYWLFRKANASGIIIGKDSYLFSQGYLRAHYGLTYIGEDKIEEKVNQLSFMKNSLEKKGKHMLFVFAASKVDIFENKVPRAYHQDSVQTNFKTYKQKLAEKKINFIDFNKMFIEKQNQYKYPLYPKTGIHWSYFGGYLAGDSLVKYVERTTKTDLPDIILDSIEEKRAQGDDNDMWRTMNIISPIQDVKYGYPKLSFNRQNKDSLNVLIIADSFYLTIYRLGIHENVFGKNSKFWFYFNEVYPPNNDGEQTNAGELDFVSEVEKFDYIIFLTQEGTLHSFGWEFVQTYCQEFYE